MVLILTEGSERFVGIVLPIFLGGGGKAEKLKKLGDITVYKKFELEEYKEYL